MSHEIDDDDEIEQHLLDRIKHVIENPSEPKNIVTKLVSFGSDFEEVRKLLIPKTLPIKETNSINQDNWLAVRREKLYYLNNLLTEWQMIKKQSSLSSKEIYESYDNIKNSLKKMNKELKGEESSSRGDVPDKSVSHHQEPKHVIFPRNKEEVYRWSSRYGPRKVHGFEHKIMAMERELVMRNMDAPFKVFGVVGVAGIGKTTFCQAIFGRTLVKEHFCPRIWVCLSKQPIDEAGEHPGDDETRPPENAKKPKDDDPTRRKEIVVRILESLGIEDEVIKEIGKGSHPLRRLILLLRLQLIGKRYLIVLDDAWNHNEFFLNLTGKAQLDDNWGEELAYALPKGSGGTIISSSRSEALLKKMIGKDASLQYLKPQPKEIIDEIFKDTVTGYDEDEREFPQHLNDLKGEILKKCDGIPLAAKLLGKIAREQLPLKSEQLPATSAGGGHETRPVSSAGAGRLKGGKDAGGTVSEPKDGFPPRSKNKIGLLPAPSDTLASMAGEVTGN